MAASVGAKPARAKATPVSRERFMMPAGYGGAWPGFETTRRATHQRPGTTGVEGAGGSGGPGRGAGGWRQGQGGPRDRPLRAAGSRVAISRAAGPNGARNTSGAASNKLNRKLRLHRRCEGRKRAWPRCPWAAGPGRGAGGWRQGQGGPRDRPLRAAGSRVAISRAGRRPPAHTAAGPHKAAQDRCAA